MITLIDWLVENMAPTDYRFWSVVSEDYSYHLVLKIRLTLIGYSDGSIAGKDYPYWSVSGKDYSYW